MRVLVTGAAGPAGRTLLDQLRERGVDALGCDLHPVHRADGIRILPVPAADDRRFVTALRGIVAAYDVDVVLPTVSEELPVLAAAHLDEIVIGPVGAVALAADKWHTAATLRRSGIAVPFTSLPGEADARSFGRPVLTKPRVSRGGRGVQVHDAWPAHIDDGDIVCEFVAGEEFCVDVHVPQGMDAATAVVLRKLALRSGRHGNADTVEAVAAADPAATELGALAVEACRALGLTGPADVDVRRRLDGTPVVLEVNARFGAHSAAAPAVLDAVLRDARRRLGMTRAPVAYEPVRVRA